MKSIEKVCIATGASIALAILLYAFRIGGESYIFITDVAAVVFSLISVITGILAIRVYNIRSLHGRALFLILLGISMWFIAEVLWIIFMSPLRLVLEALRISGYIPMTMGFFYVLSISDPRFREEKKSILLLLSGFLIFSIAYLNAVPVLLGQQSIVESIITNGYIVADFSLIFGIALLLKVSLSFRGGYMSRVWMIFSLGFLAILIFDLNFALNYKTYDQGNPSEIFWLLNYILISFGFYYNRHVISRLKRASARRARQLHKK